MVIARSFAVLASVLAPSASAGIVYVNASLSTGADDGSSWSNALQGADGVQSALAVAQPGDQVWVARGNYLPSSTGQSSVSFVLRSGVEIYGGFAGGETQLSQRNVVANPTVLDGDLAGDDAVGHFGDNSRHVVDGGTADASARLDGFTIRGGNANGASGAYAQRGGGILCAGGACPEFRDCTIRENRSILLGGGGYAESSSPSFIDCAFESNFAVNDGGGFEATTSAFPLFQRCRFASNTSNRGGGLGLYNLCDATLTDCVFWDNTATGPDAGGAIHAVLSNPVIRQCTIAGNHATTDIAGGIWVGNPVALSNNLIYFNEGQNGVQNLLSNVQGATCTWCCVQGGAYGAGNVDADPLFINLAAGDLRLRAASPCADGGNNALVPAGTTTDFEGRARISDDPTAPDTGAGGWPVVDIGAYESPNTLYALFCAADGSLSTACPCGNTGSVGRGCRSSDLFSAGALLLASGSASADSVVLTGSEIFPSGTCVFLQGDQPNASGIVFGDGVRCITGSLKRLYQKSASGGSASAPGAGDLSIRARSAALGDPIAPGAQRYYQVYYRDPDLAYCPSPPGNSWNVSSGVILNW